MNDTQSQPLIAYDRPPRNGEDVENNQQEPLLAERNVNPHIRSVPTEIDTNIENAESMLKVASSMLRLLLFPLGIGIIILGSDLIDFLSLPSCQEEPGYYEDDPSYYEDPLYEDYRDYIDFLSENMKFFYICCVCSVLMIPFQVAFARFFSQAIRERSIEKSAFAMWMVAGYEVFALVNQYMILFVGYPMPEYCMSLSNLLHSLIYFQAIVGFFFIPMIIPAYLLKRALTRLQNSEQNHPFSEIEVCNIGGDLKFISTVLKKAWL